MIVKLTQKLSIEDQHEIENLSIGKNYEVIGIEADSYRIIDHDNEPCLFSPGCFEILEKTKPTFWVLEIGQDGEEYNYPKNLGKIGFFEDYFNNVKVVVDQHWNEYNELYNIK